MSVPRISASRVTAVSVPMRRPPVSARGTIAEAPLVLLDLSTSDGLVGRAYLFVFGKPMLKPTVEMLNAVTEGLVGEPAAPRIIDASLRRGFTLYDTHGVLGQAIAAIDMAVWDIHAQAAGMPLAEVLGADLSPVPAYNSCGLWIQPVEQLADEAATLIDEGNFEAVKMRLGRPVFADDLAAVRAVRRSIPDAVRLMCDFNQSLSPSEALRRCRALDDEGLYWIEEPVRHDDYRACAAAAKAIRTPVQLGENLRSLTELEHALDAGAGSHYMPDVQRIGGVTGWMRAATFIGQHGFPLSSHLFPEVSSHLLAASDSAHYLEYVDWANPILAEPVRIDKGHALIAERPGNGLLWDEQAVPRYAVG